MWRRFCVDGRVALVSHHRQDGIAGREEADDEREERHAQHDKRQTDQTANDDGEHVRAESRV